MKPLLSVCGLRAAYGRVEALHGIDLEVGFGEVVALLGSNGAGKSTTLLTLSGLIRSTAGTVSLDGEEISRLAPHETVKRGMVQVAEGRAILARQTVRENLELGAHSRPGHRVRSGRFDEILGMFPRLQERLSQYAGNLSGGEQQMLAIGRALMAEPRLLLLDEPSMGLAPLVVRDIFSTLKQVAASGLSILIVEQNVVQALQLAQRGYVMQSGQLVLSGSAEDLKRHPGLREAYLGI
ncbi:ABC transporter ATP-binding protein [Rhizobacter sp. Root404]|uniref:ABC transporter ATP-binding protein n=1 Tax=Rhizobacter sp. Root404 TaxID=1736528 RepID=UPI0006F48DD1|nr:ABC transporter ATP-binding protein [Rhizobacter sp. Root404]KQW38392.1 ABC transporter ATP-binding protein [Rhizobacter sp. Root404]